MDEYFDVDVRVGGLKIEDRAVESIDGFEIFILRIDYPDESTNFTEDGIEIERWVHEIDLSRKIPYLEVHERADRVNVVRSEVDHTHCMESLCILAVDSKNKVSFGGILWNTTLEIDDFPLLLIISASPILMCDAPDLR